MKNLAICGLIAVVGCATVAPVATVNDAKNVYDVAFRAMPSEPKDVLALEGVWDANFRPYDQADTIDLWTDSRVVRDVKGAAEKEGERPTAIAFACDERGFNAYVACGQMAPQLEFYYLTGAADAPDVRPYYHMFYDGHALADYTMTVPDRHARHMKDYTKVEEFNVTDRDTLVRISWAWEGMWDYLPFLDGKADFWRVSMIHWAPGGGRSWGGKVHQVSAAGYVRFPVFTEEQQMAVMKHVLRCGVRGFQRLQKSYFYNPGNGAPYISLNTNAYHLAEIAKSPRSYVCYAEDPVFRPELVRLVRRCKGFVDRLETFGTLPFAERIAFYREASAALFNFERDVEEAYAKSVEDRLTKRLGGKAEAVEPVDDVPAVEHPLNEWNRKYTADFDLDKIDERLAKLSEEIKGAKTPDFRVKATVQREQILYRAARDEGVPHLKTMKDAALAKDVTCETALRLLFDIRKFRRDFYKLFDDDFSFEKLGWDRLMADEKGRGDPNLHALYYQLLGDWICRPFASEKRSRNHELSYEYSDERMLSVMEKAVKDPVLAKNPVRRYECAVRRQVEALYNLGRADEAVKVLEAEYGKGIDGYIHRGLFELYRKMAQRYCSAPDRALLEKAYAIPVRLSDRAAVAYEMGEYARALADYEKAATEKDPQWGERGDCLFGMRNFAAAASAYAKWAGRHPRERLVRVAQANAAIKNYPAAIEALEKALKVTRDEAQKTPMRYQIARLKGLMK